MMRDWEPEMDEEAYRAEVTVAAERLRFPSIEIGRVTIAGEREWLLALERAGDVQLLSLGAALRGVAGHGGHAVQRQDDDEDTPGTRNEFRFESSGGIGVGGTESDDDGEDTDGQDPDGEDEEEEDH